MKQVPSTGLIWITLLVELGVAAAVSSSLARSRTFRDLLLLTNRTARQTAGLVTMICGPLFLGVFVRMRVHDFLAADLSFETVILVGLICGPFAAMAGGAALAVPALLQGEYLALPVNLLVGLIAGTFSRIAAQEDVWSFSPLIDLSIYRWVTRNLKRPHLDRQILLLVLITAMQLGTSQLARYYPRYLFRAPLRLLAGGAGDLPVRSGGGRDTAQDLEPDSH